MRRTSAIIAVLLTAAAVAGMRASAATWVSPVAPQPGGNVAPSLNTSSIAQTKQGGIVVSGYPLNAEGFPALTLGTTGTERVEFCLNGTDAAHCRSGWDDFRSFSNKLRLSPSAADSGYVDLRAPGTDFADPYQVDASVRGIAGIPTSTLSTTGVYGQASSLEGTSYGIYADARGISSHMAIYADTDVPTVGYGGWAGYFNGSAVISETYTDVGTCRKHPSVSCVDDTPCIAQGSDDTCVVYPSLMIGGATLPPRSVNEGYICLGTDANRCRSTWPVIGGTGFWTSTADQIRPNAEQQTRSLAVAGSGESAGMSVTVNVDGVGTPIGADMNLRGTASFDMYTVGVTLTGEPVSMTCGNNLCEGLENDEFTSPYYCPQDCDDTPPGNVDVRPIELQLECPEDRGGIPIGGCTTSLPMLYLLWNEPSDPDYAGVKVIVSDTYADRPQVYTDVSHGDVGGGIFLKGEESMITECRNDGDDYYVGLFSFDNVGNYSSGVLTTVLCTDNIVMY